MKPSLFTLLFFSLISTIVFGIIDALFFFFGELTIQKYIRYHLGFNLTMSELATGGISAAISIIFSSYIDQYLKYHKIPTLDLPIIDSVGILIGTGLIIALYHVFDLESLRHFSN